MAAPSPAAGGGRPAATRWPGRERPPSAAPASCWSPASTRTARWAATTSSCCAGSASAVGVPVIASGGAGGPARPGVGARGRRAGGAGGVDLPRRRPHDRRGQEGGGPVRPADADVTLGPGVLIPAIVQDEATGDVLMLAYMDAEALEATRATGLAHFHSRSRDELWQKGATSGNTMEVRRPRVRLRWRHDPAARAARPGPPATPARRPASGRAGSTSPPCCPSWRGCSSSGGRRPATRATWRACWPPAARAPSARSARRPSRCCWRRAGSAELVGRGRRPVVPLDGAAGARRDRPAGAAGRAAKPPEVACAP